MPASASSGSSASPDADRVPAVPGVAPGESTPTAAQRVGWLELFFDLVFVVVIAQLSGHLEGAGGIGAFGGTYFLLLIVWTAWFSCVALTNLNHGVNQGERVFVLASMAGVAVMAVGLSPHHDRPAVFAVGFAMARLALTPLWARQRQRSGGGGRRVVVTGVLIAAAWVATCWVPDSLRWWCWGALMVVEGNANLRPRGATTSSQFNTSHMLERIGAFVLITFGEAVALLIEAVDHDPTPWAWVTAGIGFVLLCALFWMFYDMALDRMEVALEDRPERVGDFLGGGQFTVVAGLIALAAGLSDAVEASSQHEHLPGVQRWLLCAGVALISLGVYSLTIDAMRILIGQQVRERLAELGEHPELAAGPERERMLREHQRASRRRIVVGRMGNTVQCVGIPVLVGVLGHHWPAWLVLTLLSLSPVSMAAGAVMGGTRRPDARPAA